MSRISVLIDLGEKHVAHDVYGLWVEARGETILVGWDDYHGGQHTYSTGSQTSPCDVHEVGRPWAEVPQAEAYTAATHEGATLHAEHYLRESRSEPYFNVRMTLDGEEHDFSGDGVSCLLPAVSFASDGTPWAAWIRCFDVENHDGVIDQTNEIECARLEAGEWVREVVADLRYGLQPITGVWGYPGRRRRPYLVPDDRGGVWLLWERKTPHDGSTVICHGVLCGRRFYNGEWAKPVVLVDERYLDYVPALVGVRGGRLIVAAQKGMPQHEHGRGEVVVLSVEVDHAPVLQPEGDFSQWKTVALAKRDWFLPQDRHLELGGESYHLVFGDPHTHTCLSTDAEGDFVELLSYARDKAKLDFVAMTDNDYIYGTRVTDPAWRSIMEQDRAWSQDGSFIAVPAYEWTEAHWGAVIPQHRSILFESYDNPFLRWYDCGVAGDHFRALLSWIQTTDGIMNTQHAQFALSESDREANMEVCCGWGIYINTSDCFHEHLNRGFHSGFIGTSDGHRRTPGLGGGVTGLWVKEFTLPGIIEAFGARRCYATAGARVGLKFWVNDAFMGQTLTRGGAYVARVEAQCPRDVESLEIIADGEIVARLRDLPASFSERIGDLPEASWYYAKITMPGGFVDYPSNIAPAEGPWAWSSPVFVGE